MYVRHGVNIPGQGQLDVVKDGVESPLDGSAGHLQQDMHLLDGKLEEGGPQRAVVEHMVVEPLIHGSEFEQVLDGLTCEIIYLLNLVCLKVQNFAL